LTDPQEIIIVSLVYPHNWWSVNFYARAHSKCRGESRDKVFMELKFLTKGWCAHASLRARLHCVF